MQKKATCPTANEFVCSFLSQNFEKSPWVLKHIDQTQNACQCNISDSFDIDTSHLKSAVDYINEYNTPDDYQIFTFEQENANNAESDTDQISIQKSDSSDTNFPGDELSIEEEEEEALDLRHVYMKNARPPLTFTPDCLDSCGKDFQNLIRPNIDSILSMSYYQEQMYFVLNLTKGKLQRDIAKFFNIKPGTVSSHYKRMMTEKKDVGKPISLNKQELETVREYIEQRFYDNDIPTTYSVSHFIYDSFDKIIITDTLTKLLSRLEIAKSVKAKPIDSTRNEVPFEDIKTYYSQLKDFFKYHKVPDHFVMNTDESGFQAFANAKPQFVYIPFTEKQKDLYYPVQRQSKRATLIATVAADGTRFETIVIIERATVEKELYHMGYRPNCGYHFVA